MIKLKILRIFYISCVHYVFKNSIYFAISKIIITYFIIYRVSPKFKYAFYVCDIQNALNPESTYDVVNGAPDQMCRNLVILIDIGLRVYLSSLKLIKFVIYRVF